MSSSLTTLVPVLTGPNYQQWAPQMQSYLMSQGQWCVIKVPIPELKAEETDEQAQKIMDLEDDNAKAVGNIRLRLHTTIGYQYLNEESAHALWESLKKKYSNPGFSQAFIEFKGIMETRIPGAQDPSPAFDKIISHFARLKELKFKIPENVQAMIVLAKCPPQMETFVQVMAIDREDGMMHSENLTIEKVAESLRTSWLAASRNFPQNQQRANRLSVVKRGPDDEPQFQQQQQYQQQRGNWEGGRGGRG